jgi:hypothetical protein
MTTDTRTTAKTRENSAREAGMVARTKCGAHWGGSKTCHCTVCHRSFTVVRAFDAHRRGSYEPDRRRCVDPATVGLIDAGRAYPCWGYPQSKVDNWQSTLR